MIKVDKHTTTTVDSDSEEFKIIVKKMLFWQRKNGYFQNDTEREYQEYEWRKTHFYYGHKTDFDFSNGRKKSLVVLNFLIPLESVGQVEETGSHQEYISLISEIENGEYTLLPNQDTVICLHPENHF